MDPLQAPVVCTVEVHIGVVTEYSVPCVHTDQDKESTDRPLDSHLTLDTRGLDTSSDKRTVPLLLLTTPSSMLKSSSMLKRVSARRAYVCAAFEWSDRPKFVRHMSQDVMS